MTVITNTGLEYLSDLTFGNESAGIDTVAIGNGTSAESQTDTALDSEVYRSSEASEVTFVDSDTNGVYEVLIAIKGGLQIPGGTEITEIGAIVGANDTMIFRDTMSGVVVDSGHTVEFETELTLTR